MSSLAGFWAGQGAVQDQEPALLGLADHLSALEWAILERWSEICGDHGLGSCLAVCRALKLVWTARGRAVPMLSGQGLPHVVQNLSAQDCLAAATVVVECAWWLGRREAVQAGRCCAQELELDLWTE